MGVIENISLNETDDEFSQFLRIAQEKKVNPNQLLEEKLRPFQKKIKLSSGELIYAITREYDSSGSSTLSRRYSSYVIEETCYVGNITDTTCLTSPTEKDFCILPDFVKNVGNPCKKRTHWDDMFSETNTNSFQSSSPAFSLTSLYFFDRPPVLLADADEETHSLYQLMKPRPRLELYIGNTEVLPILEKLEGYQYMQLSRLLQRDFPLSQDMQVKIKTEHLAIYEKILELEKQLPKVEKEGKARVEFVRKTDGVIHHGTHKELTDPDLESIRYKQEAKEVFDKLHNLASLAFQRNYHEDGLIFNREKEAGITEHLDLETFFKNRVQKYEVRRI